MKKCIFLKIELLKLGCFQLPFSSQNIDMYRAMVEEVWGSRAKEQGRSEWRGRTKLLSVLAGNMGVELQRLDRGADWEAEVWQGLTQGREGERNWAAFWRDFDWAWGEARLEVWRGKDPWTMGNRRRYRRQRVQGRLWRWGVRLRLLHRWRPGMLAAGRAAWGWHVLGKGCWGQVQQEVEVLEQLQEAVWGYREQVTVWLPGLVVKVYRLGVLGRVYGAWRGNWEHREAGLGEKLEQVRGGRRLRRGFDTWWQGVLVGRLGFTVFRKPGMGATGEWTVGALKKGWEKLQARRGFGVWKGLMRQGRELRAAGWKWQEVASGPSFFDAEDLVAGYVKDKYD